MKAKRKIIRIDEAKCTGCGACIPDCPEGALQIIDGKARLVAELFCDGLGACVKTCPEGALTVEERPAEPYDEAKVMEKIVKAGSKTIAAHLKHLKEHGATEYYNQAVAYLRKHGLPVPEEEPLPCGCPGSAVRQLKPAAAASSRETAAVRPASQLANWPIQIMLVPVTAPYLRGADLLVAADCVAAAHPAFHEELVKGRVLMIGCPKLDDAQFYREKLAELFRAAAPGSVLVAHMTVPCCYGLGEIVKAAIAASGRKIPYTEVVIDIDGNLQTRS